MDTTQKKHEGYIKVMYILTFISLSVICIKCVMSGCATTVADPGIDRRGGGRFLQKIIAHTPIHSYMLYRGPGGILKSKASNDAF